MKIIDSLHGVLKHANDRNQNLDIILEHIGHVVRMSVSGY